jgi:hypothetical protein
MEEDRVITIHRKGARIFVSGPRRQQSETLKTVFDKLEFTILEQRSKGQCVCT